jgi:cholesterol transport system auxiliary component
MSPLAPPALAVSFLVALAVAGCALTSKSDALAPRYFSPERSGEAVRSSRQTSSAPAELRLGRVEGAAYLEDRLVFRDSSSELGYYEERRWTEAPEHYLKRRLSRVLYQERGLQHVVQGSAPTLDVQLTAFEEVRVPARVARVQIAVELHHQRLMLWEETVTIDKPVPANHKGNPADAVVEALGMALRIAVDRIADRVTRELASAAAPPPGAVGAAAPATTSGMEP